MKTIWTGNFQKLKVLSWGPETFQLRTRFTIIHEPFHQNNSHWGLHGLL